MSLPDFYRCSHMASKDKVKSMRIEYQSPLGGSVVLQVKSKMDNNDLVRLQGLLADTPAQPRPSYEDFEPEAEETSVPVQQQTSIEDRMYGLEQSIANTRNREQRRILSSKLKDLYMSTGRY